MKKPAPPGDERIKATWGHTSLMKGRRRLRQLNTSYPDSFIIDHVSKVVKNFLIMLNFLSSLFSQTFLSRSKANCQDLLRPFSDPPPPPHPHWMSQDLPHPSQPLSISQVCGFTINMNMMWQTWRRGQRWQTGRYSNFHPAECWAILFFFFDSTLSQTKKKKKRNFSSIFSLPLLNHFCYLNEF